MKNKCILIILFLVPIVIAFNNADSTIIVKSEKIDSIGLSPGQAYKMLYENQAKSNDAILKTIYYALGGLFSAVLLTFGSNWWFNDKKVKDLINEINLKNESIKKEMLAELKAYTNTNIDEGMNEILQVQSKFQNEISNNNYKLNDTYKEFSNKIHEEMKEKFKSLDEKYKEFINYYSLNLTQQFSSMNNANSVKFNVMSEQIKDIHNLLQERSNNLYTSVLRHEADIAFINENYNLALKALAEISKNEIASGKNWSQINKNRIFKCLISVTYLHNDEFEYINELIDVAKEGYQKDVQFIEERVRSLNLRAVER